jgi:hypothetical protein
MVGKHSGRLTIVSFSHQDARGRAFWNCLCECGAGVAIEGTKLRSGHTGSCGCLKKEIITAGANLRHGDCVDGKTSEYGRWSAMKERCYNKNDKKYPEYGGRGITVCDEWRNDFSSFLRDMGRCPTGFLLDRKDPDGNYEPGNCRWVSSKASNRNYSTRNVWITRDGQTMCLKDWAKHLGFKYGTLWKQHKEGRFISS